MNKIIGITLTKEILKKTFDRNKLNEVINPFPPSCTEHRLECETSWVIPGNPQRKRKGF